MESISASAAQLSQQKKVTGPITPLPIGKMVVLACVNINEGIQMNIIWPFIPAMVRQWYDSNQLGIYTGLLASSFFFIQFLSALYWGWLADKIGRRPTLLAGVLLSSGAIVLFGFSGNYSIALTGRLLGGLMNGNLGITKSYLAEMTDSTNQAKGFSILMVCWGGAAILSPILGGVLSQPADKYEFFQDINLFIDYQFLLPCLFAGGVSILIFILGYFLLGESEKWLEEKEQSQKQNNSEDIDDRDSDDIQLDDLGTSLLHSHSMYHGCCLRLKYKILGWIPEVATNRNALHACFCYGGWGGTWILMDELVPLFCEGAEEDGGLGYSVEQISIFLALQGAALVLFQLTFYVRVARYLGAVKGFTLPMIFSVFFFWLFPTVAMVHKNAPEAIFWVYLIIMLAIRAVLFAVPVTASMLLINNSVPTSYRATANGLGQSIVAVCRGIGPLIGGTFWSISTSMHQWYGPFLPYGTLGILAFGCVVLGISLPKSLDLPLDEQGSIEKTNYNKVAKYLSVETGNDRKSSSYYNSNTLAEEDQT